MPTPSDFDNGPSIGGPGAPAAERAEARRRLTSIAKRGGYTRHVVCDAVADYQDWVALKTGEISRHEWTSKVAIRHSGYVAAETALEVYDLATTLNFGDIRSVAQASACL